MFNFDEFVNQPCIAIFGRSATYIPANNQFASFEIKGDFHKDYKEVQTGNLDASISSSQIVLFVRDVDMSVNYPKANQGDYLKIENINYQIIDVQIHIPGSKKLILHESSANIN